MADDEYIITTKCFESSDFVFMKKTELSYENFCSNGKFIFFHIIFFLTSFDLYSFTVARTFNLERDFDFKVKLKANNNTNLTKTNFNRVVEYYSRCACFQITVQLERKTMCDVLITADVSPNFDFISITKTNFFFVLISEYRILFDWKKRWQSDFGRKREKHWRFDWIDSTISDWSPSRLCRLSFRVKRNANSINTILQSSRCCFSKPESWEWWNCEYCMFTYQIRHHIIITLYELYIINNIFI